MECLSDPVGPAGVDAALQAIVVSRETEKGGAHCNTVRAQNGLAPMAIYVTNLYDRSGNVMAGSDMDNKVAPLS
jgi:phosphopantetheine adenylyltransferase